jgi:hypothetical protein
MTSEGRQLIWHEAGDESITGKEAVVHNYKQ